MGIKLGSSEYKFSYWSFYYGDLWNVTHTGSSRNITIYGTGEDETIQLDELSKDKTSDRDNPDIFFDGRGGTDTLEYYGDTKSVTMSVSDDADWEFYLEGGRGTNKGDKNLSSLDVYTTNVEIFKLTKKADTVDISDWSGNDYTVQIYGGDGDDTILGSDFDDKLFGEDGSDEINAGLGDDFVDPGDINTGGQDIVTLGEGYDTLYLGDLGTPESDYYEISEGLSDWESYAIDTGTSLPSTIFSASMKSLFQAWVKQNPVTAVVMSVAFEAGGSALGNLFSSIFGGTKIEKSGNNTETDQSSYVKLEDFNSTEDMIILPILNFDSVTTGTGGYNNQNLIFSLDAENGGKFLEAVLVNTIDIDSDDVGDFAQFLADTYEYAQYYADEDWNGTVSSAYGSAGHVLSSVNEALWDGIWGSSITFSKFSDSEAGGATRVVAMQGSTYVYDSLDSSLNESIDFSALATMLDSQLDIDDTVMITGNFLGQNVQLDSSLRYANGNDKSDTFTIVAAGSNSVYYVNGNDGDDLLEVGQLTGVGINYHGGDGTDMISFADAHVLSGSSMLQTTYGVTIDLNNTTHESYVIDSEGTSGAAQNINLWSVEGVIGTEKEDKLYGNEEDNIFISSGGGDHMEGAGGDDVLYGGTGWDRMKGDGQDDTSQDGDDYFYTGDSWDLIWGGGGSDTADFTTSTHSGWKIDLSNKWDASTHWAFENNNTGGTYVKPTTSGDHVKMTGIENVVGSTGNDTITGDEGANVLYGDAGNDTIKGNDGADIISGGTGNDILTGGDDYDVFLFDVDSGDFGSDTILDLDLSFNGGINMENLLFLGDDITVDDLTIVEDGSGNAVIITGAGTVTLDGVDMNDLVFLESPYSNSSLGYVDQDCVYAYIS